MKKSIYLTDTENAAVQLLAKGARLSEVRKMTQLQNYAFHSFLAVLRKKTGISDVQSIPECREFVHKLEKYVSNPPLSRVQTRLLSHILDDTPMEFIARSLNLSAEETKNLLSETLKTCGIYAKKPEIIRSQIRMHFAIYGNPHVDRGELSTSHWQILRAIAKGEDLKELGFRPAGLKALTADATKRSWTNCPGKDAQRRLVCLFVATHDAKQAITMDDPAF